MATTGSNSVLRRLAVETKALSGDAFLEHLVIALSSGFESSFAEIGLISDDQTRVRAELCALDGRLQTAMEYTVEGMPCAQVMDAQTHYQDGGLMDAFPRSARFGDRRFDSYIASPIFGPSGDPIGVLAVISPHALRLGDADVVLFEQLAARVAAEMGRAKARSEERRREEELREIVRLHEEAESQSRHERERFRLVAEYTLALASAQDLEQTLERVAYLPVPRFADSCAVILFDDDDVNAPIVAESHVDPEIERQLREHRTNAPARMVEVRDALMAGESILVPDLDEKIALGIGLEEAAEQRVRLRTIHSVILVPLVCGGKTIGTLFFTTSRRHSDREFSNEDLEYAKSLGLRAGTAIEHARLYAALTKSHQQKDQFLAMLAHELRNPIAAIINAVSVLEIGSEKSRPRALEIAKRQAHQQARLIDDLLDVSRITRGKVVLRKRQVSVFEMLKEVTEAQRIIFERKAQKLVLDIPYADQAWVSADPTRLEQIIVNILDNASKYTGEGGTIRVSAERDEERVTIRISDTGQGLEETMLERVFDMFQQAPSGGTLSSGLGIGLTVTRELVRLHGGTVGAASEGRGKGSTFKVQLPLSRGRSEHLEEEQSEQGHHVRRRILVVDDNVDAAGALSELLTAWGHDVETVNDGRSAVLLAEEFAPELALVDIAMPGMDGYATARGIRDLPHGDRIYLVALTGYGQPADIQKALEARFDRHLTKPARHETLLHLVESLSICQ